MQKAPIREVIKPSLYSFFEFMTQSNNVLAKGLNKITKEKNKNRKK
tara:strand:- start:98 stop:235 length:138 start_codon:yes stop_codon:yes gene_type:complete